jgi:hypothetical protein
LPVALVLRRLLNGSEGQDQEIKGEGGSGLAEDYRDGVAYRKLAAQVINAAVTDFGGWPHRLRVPQIRGVSDRKHGLEYRLTWLRNSIDAGRFLIERDDEIVRFWFHLAGLNRNVFRRHQAWVHRLAALRAQERELRQTFNRRRELEERGDGRAQHGAMRRAQARQRMAVGE